MKKKILVLCTGNSCRSQMAEGYLRYFGNEKIEVYSAGIETHGLNPRAVEVMAEDGIDISGHSSNHVDEFADINFDVVLTVCDHANERCPVFPSHAKKIHHNFTDPAKAVGSQDEIMQSFRTTRNEIREYCKSLLNVELYFS